MLTRLKIDNYALIRQLDTEFGSGLNIITGETGAGKSILIGAIGLLLGDRADTSVLLDKQVLCRVEGWFSPIPSGLSTLLEACDIWLESGEALRLRREITPSGKSRALINDTVVTLAQLKEAGQQLAEIHGQQDTRILNEPQAQLQLFDDFAEAREERKKYEQAWANWTEAQDYLLRLKQEQAEWSRNQEFIRFQFEELDNASLQPGEDLQLDQDLKKLESAEQIRETLSNAFIELYEQDGSIYNRLASIHKQLAKFEALDPEIAEENARLMQALDIIRESGLSLQALEENTDADPASLSNMQERQNLYQRLKLKFQVQTAEALLLIREDLGHKVMAGDSREAEIRKLEESLENLKAQVLKTGILLDKKRQKSLKAFQEKIQLLLSQVGMEGASCIPELNWNKRADAALMHEDHRIDPLKSGLNTFRLLARTNPGTPTGPMNQIASGGELSRIMLAIKTAIASITGTPVLIFDEIDTGISGETALKVGNVMLQLSETTQIFSITHLPQIAAKGQHHYLLFKERDKGLTASDIRKLNHTERIQAIANMIGGENPGKAALDHAADLLKG